MFFEIYKKGKSIFKKVKFTKLAGSQTILTLNRKSTFTFQLTFISKIFIMIQINKAVYLVYLISKNPTMAMRYSEGNEKYSKVIRFSKLSQQRNLKQ